MNTIMAFGKKSIQIARDILSFMGNVAEWIIKVAARIVLFLLILVAALVVLKVFGLIVLLLWNWMFGDDRC